VWRPTPDRAIITRIHDRQSARSRLTVGALGWAAGVSIAVNVVFATGFAAQIGSAIFPPAPATPIASLAIRLPAQTFAKPLALAPAARLERRALRPYRVAANAATHRTFAHAHAATPARIAPAEDPQPDVFADLLDANAPGASKKVAIETSFTRTESLQP
jgi:hypothetical protein